MPLRRISRDAPCDMSLNLALRGVGPELDVWTEVMRSVEPWERGNILSAGTIDWSAKVLIRRGSEGDRLWGAVNVVNCGVGSVAPVPGRQAGVTDAKGSGIRGFVARSLRPRVETASHKVSSPRSTATRVWRSQGAGVDKRHPALVYRGLITTPSWGGFPPIHR